MDKDKLQNFYENHPLIKEIYDRINSKLRPLPEGWYTDETTVDSFQPRLLKNRTIKDSEGNIHKLAEVDCWAADRKYYGNTMVSISCDLGYTFYFYDTEDGGFIWRIHGDVKREYPRDIIVIPEDKQKNNDYNFRKLFYENFNVSRLSQKYGNSVHRAYDVFLKCELITKDEYDEVQILLDKLSYLAGANTEQIDKQILELKEEKKKIEEEIKEIESSLNFN